MIGLWLTGLTGSGGKTADEGPEGKLVSVGAQAGDLRDAGGGGERRPAEIVPRLDVAHVHLDRGDRGGFQRIVDGDAGMGIGGGA